MSAFVFSIGLFAGSLSFAAESTQETTEQQLLISLERIWDRAPHSAFTDLVAFRDALYCTFREGSGHIPGFNGVIRVIRSSDGMNWESVALLAEEHVDLRDPKLSVTPDGRLMISTGASYYHGSTRLKIESRVAFSDSKGENFSSPQKVEFPNNLLTGMDWLWRVTWHKGQAYGCIQQLPTDEPRQLQLVRSRDGIRYEHVAALDVDAPSETTLRFLADDSLVAMIRRSSQPSEGDVGVSRPPYTQWKITRSNRQLGGPNFVELPNGLLIAGSRGYDKSPRTTELWRFDVAQARFEEILTLPSGGDNSYPGMVVDREKNRLYVSYYSGHEGKSSIYLATFRLDAFRK